MKIKILSIICLFTIAQSYSQSRITDIITTQNDTIKNVELKNKGMAKNELYSGIQEKVIILDENGTKELLPNEIKSFTIDYGDQVAQYESVNNVMFAELLYSDKIKLLRVNTRTNFIFIIKRPNNGKTSFLEAMGLSRLISLKVITRELGDCPDLVQKVDEKVLKVHGVEGVVELAKYYEANCLK